MYFQEVRSLSCWTFMGTRTWEPIYRALDCWRFYVLSIDDSERTDALVINSHQPGCLTMYEGIETCFFGSWFRMVLFHVRWPSGCQSWQDLGTKHSLKIGLHKRGVLVRSVIKNMLMILLLSMCGCPCQHGICLLVGVYYTHKGIAEWIWKVDSVSGASTWLKIAMWSLVDNAITRAAYIRILQQSHDVRNTRGNARCNKSFIVEFFSILYYSVWLWMDNIQKLVILSKKKEWRSIIVGLQVGKKASNKMTVWDTFEVGTTKNCWSPSIIMYIDIWSTETVCQSTCCWSAFELIDFVFVLVT